MVASPPGLAQRDRQWPSPAPLSLTPTRGAPRRRAASGGGTRPEPGPPHCSPRFSRQNRPRHGGPRPPPRPPPLTMREPRSTPPGRIEGLRRLPPLHLPRSRPLSGCRDEGPKGMSGSGSARGGSSGASRLTGFPAGQSGRPASRVPFGDWSAAEATGRTASPGVSCMRGGGFGKENGSGCGEAVAAAAAESPPDILTAGPSRREFFSASLRVGARRGPGGWREAPAQKRRLAGLGRGSRRAEALPGESGPLPAVDGARARRAAELARGETAAAGAERRARWERAHVGRGRGAGSWAAPRTSEGGGETAGAFLAARSSKPGSVVRSPPPPCGRWYAPPRRVGLIVRPPP